MLIRCRTELAALVLVLLAACKPGGERAEAPLPPVGEAKVALEQAACVKRGGDWITRGDVQLCATRTRDSGKACRTASDCQGACLARSQTCAPVIPLTGCNEIITSVGMRVTECVN